VRLAKVGVALAVSLSVALSACSSTAEREPEWTEEEVSFVADGLTLYGTYRHREDEQAGPAALLISESGATDRNGDNQVAGPVGNMRQLAELLSEHDVASLRYDKVGTGKTGLGPYAQRPTEVVSAVYTAGAKAAVRYLAEQPRTDDDRISVYALGEGAVHAMALATDTTAGAPKIHSLGLFQPMSGRYLDIITNRVRASASPEALATWEAAVEQVRTTGTVPENLPEGLGALLNPGNVNAVVEADRIDPLALAAKIPAGTPVLLTCSDSDGQASCDAVRPLAEALRHTDLTLVELAGVNHVLRDDPTDNVANYAEQKPLSPQVVEALDEFVGK
jgi:alpha-beta hydrolase superfamily lysophospholipase